MWRLRRLRGGRDLDGSSAKTGLLGTGGKRLLLFSSRQVAPRRHLGNFLFFFSPPNRSARNVPCSRLSLDGHASAANDGRRFGKPPLTVELLREQNKQGSVSRNDATYVTITLFRETFRLWRITMRLLRDYFLNFYVVLRTFQQSSASLEGNFLSSVWLADDLKDVQSCGKPGAAHLWVVLAGSARVCFSTDCIFITSLSAQNCRTNTEQSNERTFKINLVLAAQWLKLDPPRPPKWVKSKEIY